MNLTTRRSVDPQSFGADVEFDETDLTAAFEAQSDPDEQLFYDLFSTSWLDLTVSEKLDRLSRVAALVEASRATKLNLTASTPQPK